MAEHRIYHFKIAVFKVTSIIEASKQTVYLMNRDQLTRLEQIPNIGRASADDLRLIGICHPNDLIGRDPYQLYEKLCEKTGHRHDPCVIDVFISAVRYMEGEPKRPWWDYTIERKRALMGKIHT